MVALTVVMAHAGEDRFLPTALRSLAAQTLRELEVVVVDDASGVDFEALLRGLPRLRVRILHNQSRQGLARSLNRGLQACETPYVARMDSDDSSAPERLERQLGWLERHPDVTLLGTAVRYIDERDRELSRTFPLTAPEDLRLAFLAYNQLAHGSVVARRDRVLRAGGYDEGSEVSQDYELWLRLLRAGERVANLPEPLYSQRLHGQSTSVARRKLQIARARGVRDAMARELAGAELERFFAEGRQRVLGRPYERLQLGKLALFAGYLASRPGVRVAVRARALRFAARHGLAAAAVLRAEGAWHREWSRWLRLGAP